MKKGKAYLLFWLALQWLFAGPLLALFGFAMFFSDAHGLPTDGAGFLVAYLLVLTIGFAYALRVVLTWREDT